jgi:hypothetical protein
MIVGILRRSGWCRRMIVIVVLRAMTGRSRPVQMVVIVGTLMGMLTLRGRR